MDQELQSLIDEHEGRTRDALIVLWQRYKRAKETADRLSREFNQSPCWNCETFCGRCGESISDGLSVEPFKI